MKNKEVWSVTVWLGQKEKRPQEGGVGPKILSTAGLMHLTIVTCLLIVKLFSGMLLVERV